MKYALIFHASPEETHAADTSCCAAYVKAMEDAGILCAGVRLMPPDDVVRISTVDGRTRIEDGPFADSREQLGGMVVIDVEDAAAARLWAERSPAARMGVVEVWPVDESPLVPAEEASAAAAGA